MPLQFTDRQEAGRLIAEKLSKYRGQDAVVLVLPRGGVVTGYEIAKELSLPLDIIAVRKIGHPMAPEYAIGAVGESGEKILNETETASVDQVWLKEEIAREEKEARRRGVVYREGRKALEIAGKTVIIVDDGIATGLTMRFAVRFAKARKPEKIIVAVPVAPEEALRTLKDEGVDEIVALLPPEEFLGSVGAHYLSFDQVEDEEVIRLMRLSVGETA